MNERLLTQEQAIKVSEALDALGAVASGPITVQFSDGIYTYVATEEYESEDVIAIRKYHGSQWLGLERYKFAINFKSTYGIEKY